MPRGTTSEVEEEKERVIDILSNKDEDMTAKEVAEELFNHDLDEEEFKYSRRQSFVGRARYYLELLVEDGKVEREEQGGGNLGKVLYQVK